MATCGYIFYWYKGKNLGLAIGLIPFCGLIASAANFATSPMLYNVGKSLALPAWVASIYCAATVVGGMIAVIITNYAEGKRYVPVKLYQSNNFDRNKKKQ